MRLEDAGFDDAAPIDAYGGGGFRIAGRFYGGGLLLLPDAPPAALTAAAFSDLDAARLAPLIAAAREGRIDAALIGAGEVGRPVPGVLRAAFDAVGLGVDAMSTGAACRTYNVLLSEGRRVGAALLSVD